MFAGAGILMGRVPGCIDDNKTAFGRLDSAIISNDFAKIVAKFRFEAG